MKPNPCFDSRCAAAGKCCCDKTHKYMTTNNEEVTLKRMKEINEVVDADIEKEIEGLVTDSTNRLYVRTKKCPDGWLIMHKEVDKWLKQALQDIAEKAEREVIKEIKEKTKFNPRCDCCDHNATELLTKEKT